MENTHYAITINRQFGSLGRPIAKRLSELLNITFYDRDIVDSVAKSTNIPVSVISSEEESAKTGLFGMKFPLGRGTNETQDRIYEIQRQIIANIAAKEDCIIVGRCSEYVLRNHPALMRVYIYASHEQRLKNCIENLNMKEEDAVRLIQEVDNARNAYHLRYAGYLPSDVSHNDLLINSGFLGVDGTAECLYEIVKRKLL